MADEEKHNKPVIIKRKKNGHAGHHGGAWKVAYADFVTAMMAFFLVMWLVSQSDAVKQAVGGYFRDPVGFSEKAGKGALEGSAAPFKAPVPAAPDLQKKHQAEEKKLKTAGEKIREAIENSNEAGKIKDYVEIEIVPEGLRIQLIDASAASDSAIFFDLGSSKLKPWAQSVLATIGSELGKLPNHIIVEGHTDSRPFVSSNGYTNWELSSDRANSARRLMESSGLKGDQIIEIRGYADVQLRLPERPEDPRNRRVAIIVLNEAYEQRFKDIQVGNDLAGIE